MAEDGFLRGGRIELNRTAIRVGHPRVKKLVRGELGCVWKKIRVNVGSRRRLVVKPMPPLIGRRTVIRTCEPALIAHQQFAIHGGGINPMIQTEEHCLTAESRTHMYIFSQCVLLESTTQS